LRDNSEKIIKKVSSANYYFFQQAENKKAGPKAGLGTSD
jgi:hypothetical protein